MSIHTITLGMGCFWSPDALFGSLPGVVRTCTGYAGGTTAGPTYRSMGDHTEMVEVVYDEAQLTLERILDVFWSHHSPLNINDYKGRQYQSILLYRDSEQLERIEAALEAIERREGTRPATDVMPLLSFTPAEERHQKYYLKRYPDAVGKLRSLYRDEAALTESTVAARLNGLAKGYTNLTAITDEIRGWVIDESERERLLQLVRSIKW
ncbi:peptide-methionine (S)-S-oxide reductase [Paenibacillus sp. YYML68]|uniref:peptide-methionine (S)-S-oxide reductase MsrA n=1 Tax=Paenibacillus sp. YYML68 TaxID=2909250 RepID=UPI0024910AAD|nr:peptide-methionine (S)-S-oxide reductase [Paenibacillus sp. YYML68]